MAGELVEYFNKTDLDYPEYHEKCRQIGMLKMIDLTDELLQGWYIEFIKAGWSRDYFLQRCEVMKKTKVFGGSLDIQLWFEEEETFNGQQVHQMIEKRVNSLIAKGETILRGQTLTLNLPDIVIDLDAIKLAVSKRINDNYNSDNSYYPSAIYDELTERVVEEFGFKRKHQEEKKGIGTRLRERFDQKFKF